MQIGLFSYGALSLLLVAGCNGPDSTELIDGCYYSGQEPVLRIAGERGRVLLPGNVSNLVIVVRGSSDFAWLTTQPNFKIDGADHKVAKIDADSSSPVILIDEGARAALLLIRDRGEVVELAHRKSCPG